MQPLGLKDVKKLLPHREPILLIDEVLDYTIDKSLTARRFLPKNDPVFKGHFPAHPIMPGMLTVEAMAQAAAILVSLSRGLFAEQTLFYFMGVDEVRFKKPVFPGSTLTLEVRQHKRLGDIYRYGGEAYLTQADGTRELAASATFMAMLKLKE
jgi:3-hydroxyacyl-[acyl-carrier-protein] dehydratase